MVVRRLDLRYWYPKDESGKRDWSAIRERRRRFLKGHSDESRSGRRQSAWVDYHRVVHKEELLANMDGVVDELVRVMRSRGVGDWYSAKVRSLGRVHPIFWVEGSFTLYDDTRRPLVRGHPPPEDSTKVFTKAAKDALGVVLGFFRALESVRTLVIDRVGVAVYDDSIPRGGRPAKPKGAIQAPKAARRKERPPARQGSRRRHRNGRA